MKAELKTEWSFALGDAVYDTVSGFKGKITSRTEWLNGCKRYSLQPQVDPKEPSKIPDMISLDEAQLAAEPSVAPTKIERKETGGDRPEPKRFRLP